jgi:cell division control protein 6
MSRILLDEATLDPTYVPPRLVHREKEHALLLQRYRDSLGKNLPYHQLLTGGIGSGKTALAHRLGDDLQRQGRIGSMALLKLYVNCWRRSNERTILLEVLRGIHVHLPDRGYGLAEMYDIFEQSVRRTPRHLFLVLDEVSALVRQNTKIVYTLTRSRELGLGSISLFLVAPEDVLPYMDAASRSSFGVTHRLALAKYTAAQLAGILEARAKLALRPGSFSREVLEQIGRTAAPTGDARFALELLVGAARAAESQGRSEILPEQVRAAKGSLYPTVSEQKLQDLSIPALSVLLAVARTLRAPRGAVTSERVRSAYASLAEEHGERPISRSTFWRTLKELEREGLIDIEQAGSGESARLSMNEIPASLLEIVLEEKVAASGEGKG